MKKNNTVLRLEGKRDEITKVFNSLADQLNEKRAEMEKVQKEMTDIIDEQKRLQGEFRLVSEMLQESSHEEEQPQWYDCDDCCEAAPEVTD